MDLLIPNTTADPWNWSNETDHQVYNTLQDMPISQIWEFQAVLAITKYVFIVIIVVGTIGNGMSVAVLTRRRMRSNSVNFYLACLAGADTTVLYVSAFKTWLRVVTNVELLHLSGASCKILTFLFITAIHASAWFVVLVTADRFIVVWFPFKATTMCTQRRGRIASAVMIIVVVVYNMHLFWTMELFVVPQMTQCVGAHGNRFMNGIYEMLKLISYSIIPFTFVLLMNVGIIIKICQHSRSTDGVRLRYDVREDSRSLKSRQQMTIMLLVVSFAWLILSTPFSLIAIFPVNPQNQSARAKQFLAKTVCFLLMYINHSINFFLYCIAGKKFRGELFSMLRDFFNLCRKLERRSSFSFGSKTRRTKLTPPEFEDDEF